jgi:hypothetical protein
MCTWGEDTGSRKLIGKEDSFTGVWAVGTIGQEGKDLQRSLIFLNFVEVHGHYLWLKLGHEDGQTTGGCQSESELILEPEN